MQYDSLLAAQVAAERWQESHRHADGTIPMVVIRINRDGTATFLPQYHTQWCKRSHARIPSS